MANSYSADWYTIFLDSIPAGLTQVEVAFIERQLPLDEFPRVLDLCCGPARHAAVLSKLGYRVHGVDVNESAIRQARTICPDATFEVLDMRKLESLPGPFDAVVNLWHSFGYFDDATNFDILCRIRALLRPAARAKQSANLAQDVEVGGVVEVTEAVPEIDDCVEGARQ